MRPLAKCALIGTTISLSLTWALLSMIPPVIAVLIWIMIPGFLLAWGASGMLQGTYADIFALGNAQLLVLVTIGNAIFYWCVSHFLLRAPRDG
jgi:hypothetical protein